MLTKEAQTTAQLALPIYCVKWELEHIMEQVADFCFAQKHLLSFCLFMVSKAVLKQGWNLKPEASSYESINF